MKSHCHANELFGIGRDKNNEECVKRITKNPDKVNSKLRAYISNRGSGYYKQDPDDVELIFNDSKI